jgi:hypothetical protein
MLQTPASRLALISQTKDWSSVVWQSALLVQSYSLSSGFFGFWPQAGIEQVQL